METLLGWSLLLIAGCVGGWGSGMLYLTLSEAWERRKPKARPDHTLTLTGPDGSPLRQQKMTAAGAGRIIAELDRRPQGYR
ncbi:hypothetical protein [Singulisphaera sp. PoT]|uniref:hypothetical protein n=1 Tax=Singulisphaera sp. PoT TaxID=3411797 RepID=UPI003BF4FB92